MYTQKQITAALKNYSRKVITQQEFSGFARASVLIPLYIINGELSVLLTVRTDEVETHKGQISFPGGMRDESDPDAVHNALRETEEEIGVKRDVFTILGVLDDHPVPTKYIITPVVGYSVMRPVISPNPAEVAEIFDVPLFFFANEQNAKTEHRLFNGREITVWHYQYNNHIIWGATAAIIRNLIAIVSNHAK